MTPKEYVAYLKAKIKVIPSKKSSSGKRFVRFLHAPYEVTITHKEGLLYYFGIRSWVDAPPLLREAFRQLISEYAEREWKINDVKFVAIKERTPETEVSNEGNQKKSLLSRLFH